MDILGKLFGSSNRIKVLRLFLLNPDVIFEAKEISRRCKVAPSSLRREISVFSGIGFIKRRSIKRGKAVGWQVDMSFPYFSSLKSIIFDATPISENEILKKVRNACALKLLILSGIFIDDGEGQVDMFIVGDKLKKNVLTSALKDIESKVGKELEYAYFDTDEFIYRLGVYDKFIRDALDRPHKKVFNKLDI